MSEEIKNTPPENEEYFDKHKAYTEEVVPLMQQLHDACKKHGLPHMLWIVFSNSECRSGQGLIFQNHRRGFEKMSVLAHIADGDLSTDQLAAAAIAFKMVKMFAKSDAEKKTEVAE